MRTRRNHQLPNLSFAFRIFATAVLLLGFGLFVSVWFASVLMGGWGLGFASFFELGTTLLQIRTISELWFYALFSLHGLSLPLILGLAHTLFRRVALPRGARTALLAGTVGLAVLDISAWVLLPWSVVAETLLPWLLALESLFILYLVLTPISEMWVYTRWRAEGPPKRVVIVGGGFGGLYSALGLDSALGYHEGLEIVVVDRRNYFLFPPMLPSVATGSIETRQVTYPFRRVFEATNVVFRKECVLRIDPDRREVHTRLDLGVDPDSHQARTGAGTIQYDYLVVAPGSETNTFRTPGAEKHCFYMRELGDATGLRNHIIDCFEAAAHEPDARVKAELLRFVIVGGGPTGVELAAEIQDLIRHVLSLRYPEVDPALAEVYVVQSAGQVLPGWDGALVGDCGVQLSRIGVKLLLSTRVTEVKATTVVLGDGQELHTRTCVWCAGVKPAGLLSKIGLPLGKDGRVLVEPDLRVAGRPEVFVLGDAAFYPGPDGKPLPALAQVAFQQGAAAADNIRRLLLGRPTRSFRYFNYGSLLAVGERFAVVDLIGLRLSGFFAWVVWRALYVGKLVGFGNKVRVLLDWALDLLVERSISQIAASRRVSDESTS